MAGPTRTSSPVQSQKTTQDLDEMRLQARNPEVAERLLEACKKIQEAMLLLNSSKDTNVTTYPRHFISLTFKYFVVKEKSTRGL